METPRVHVNPRTGPKRFLFSVTMVRIGDCHAPTTNQMCRNASMLVWGIICVPAVCMEILVSDCQLTDVGYSAIRALPLCASETILSNLEKRTGYLSM